MKEYRNPDTIHPPIAGYTHQIELSGPERLLAISGQVGIKPDGTLPSDPVEQLAAALENVKRNLDAAGMDVTDLVKVTFYLACQIDADSRAGVMRSFFHDYKPTMMLLYVTSLATPDIKVEVEAWASSDRPKLVENQETL